MKRSIERIRNFLKEENGATAVEYGLMVSLIAAAIIITVTALGQKVDATFAEVSAAM